jgi:hypothetical protein
MDELEFQKIKNQYSKLFEKIPADLIRIAVEDKTASQVSTICLKNGIKDEKLIGEIAYQIGAVLLGHFPPEVLPKAIEKNLEIDSEVAKKIYLETDQFIFSQVKPALEELYKAGIIPSARSSRRTSQEKTSPSKGTDVYRESPE